MKERNGRRRLMTGLVACAMVMVALTPVMVSGETIEERITRLEKLMDSGGGMKSAKGNFIQLSGELEYEYSDAESDGLATPQVADTHGHFDIDKFVLKPIITITDDISMSGELTYNETNTFIDEWAFKWKNLPGGLFAKLAFEEKIVKEKGFTRLWGYETESIPMISKAWYEDDQHNLLVGGYHKVEQVDFLQDIGWFFSYGSGLETDTNTGVGEDGGIELTHDNDRNASDTTEFKKEIGLGATALFTFPDHNYDFEVFAWTYDGNLDRDDKVYISNISGYGAIDTKFANASNTGGGIADMDDTQTRTGFRTTHRFKKLGIGDLLVTWMMADAEDGKLERSGDFLQASYKIKFDKPLWDGYFQSVTPFVRIGSYEVDKVAKAFGDDDTWDHDQVVLAAILGITNQTKLKVEWYMIESKTGGAGGATQPGDIDHDEFLLQLEVKF